MISFKKLNIGAKLFVLPVIAAIGLSINTGVDLFQDHQINQMNLTIERIQAAAIYLTGQLHLEINYLVRPTGQELKKIKENKKKFLQSYNESRGNTDSDQSAILLDTIKETNIKHNNIFRQASTLVLEIHRLRNELSTLFHESDTLANDNINQISLKITHLMLEGKTISPAKRELRNSLREFIGLTSDAMLNTNELLFLSDAEKYELAEKKRERNLFLVTRACNALSVVTNDIYDSKNWKLIEAKQLRIREIRDALYSSWIIRERLTKELKTVHVSIQDLILQLIDVINNDMMRFFIYHKWISIVTIASTLIVFSLLWAVLVHDITMPVQRLISAISNFKDGRPGALVRLNGHDEIAVLSRAFNEMIQRIRQDEDSIRQSEEKFKKMIEKSPLPMVITDANQDISYFNDKFTELFGYSLEDVSTAEKWWQLAYPEEDYRIKVQQSWADAIETAMLNNKDIKMQEWDLTIKDRTIRRCEFYMVPLDNVSMIIMNDITEKKKAEKDLWDSQQRFRNIFDSHLDAIFVLDAKQPPAIVSCNAATAETFGYEVNELIGKTVTHLHVSTLHLEEFQAIFQSEIQKKGVLKDVEFTMKRKDGTIFPTEHIVLEMTNDIYERTGWISIVRDLTERKQLESRLRQAQKMEAMGTLAGGIAHDFNNILFPLIGFTEILEEDLPDDNPLHEYVTEIFQAALRAKDLVNQILTFSRQTELEVKPIKLQPILKEALKLLRASIPKTIDIQTAIDPDCSSVLADPTQMHQILMNLATNASHSMEKSGGRLKISLEEIDADSVKSDFSESHTGKYVFLKVSDQGTGIKKEALARIFDPYFTTKKTGNGTGLGLSVVQGIVKSANGDIYVSSDLGKGTEVHIYLPVVVKEAITQSQNLSQPIQGGTERILLVDDEEAVIRLEQKMLERLGYQITARAGSIEAFETFKLNPDKFDLIITDMTMPEMTGIELADKIKAVRTDIPIIIVTGFSEQINMDDLQKKGVNGFLLKPVVQTNFANVIRKTIAIHNG